jgi:hypothetical protein
MTRYLSMYLEGGVSGGNRLLSEQGIETMLRGNTNQRTQALQSHTFSFQYGAGWFVGAFGAAEDARWHLGNLPEFTAWMVLLPETNQGVIVLINAGSQFEFFGANEAFSRIPVGIVNVLRGERPPTGMGMTRFYILFDAAVVAVVAVQIFAVDGTFQEDELGLGTVDFVLFLIGIVGLSVFLTWIVGRTGSILIALFTHMAINLTGMLLPDDTTIRAGEITVILLVAAALVAWKQGWQSARLTAQETGAGR